jgi:hypothetical protein
MVKVTWRDDDAGMRLLALLLVLVPVLLVRVGPAFAEDPPGVVVRDLVWAAPVEFPPDTAMYVTTSLGCIQCGRYDEAIYRVSRAGYGPVHVDEIVGAQKPQFNVISGFAVSPDASLLAVSLFDSSHCSAGPSNSCLAVTDFKVSRDGGLSWSLVGSLVDRGGVYFGFPEFKVIAASETDVYYTNLSDEGAQRLSDGSRLTTEEALILTGPYTGRSFVWNDVDQTIATIAPSEQVITVPTGQLPRGWTGYTGPQALLLNEGHRPVITWRRTGGPGPLYLTRADADGILRGVRLTGMHGSGASWMDERLIAATLWQTQDSCPECAHVRLRPSLVDLDAGVAYPIAHVFETAPLAGNNTVRRTIRGPFLRVATAECLPVRAWADAFASVTACAAPGVLLRPVGGVRWEHGVEWRVVSLPNGTVGWVPRGSAEG